MALLVSLQRSVEKIELGAFEVLRLVDDDLYEGEGEKRLLARHRHNRWMKADDPEPFVRLEIAGPLLAYGPADMKLGPYQHFSTFDGVLYVENRVFGFWDAQHKDWYIVDAGEHWKELFISFHTTEP